MQISINLHSGFRIKTAASFLKNNNEHETLNGKTISGYSYHVYYSDLEIRKGQIVRCYKIFLSVTETDMVLIDAYHYTFKEVMNEDDYWDAYILPVVRSLNIEFN